jgi:extradiol dioxygenase family protein
LATIAREVQEELGLQLEMDEFMAASKNVTAPDITFQDQSQINFKAKIMGGKKI